MILGLLLQLTFSAIALGAPEFNNGRIIGGRDADITEFPHQISLLLFDSPYCGGSIISEKYVITAGHCTDGYQNRPTLYSVQVNSSFVDSGGQRFNVAKINQNPRFSQDTLDYDISIIELEDVLQFGVGVQPINLPEAGLELPAGTPVTVSGYGDTTYPRAGQNLQAVDINVIGTAECNRDYDTDVGAPQVTDRMICAGTPEGGKDHCFGDSGGPIITEDKTLVGIVSWALGCAIQGYPGVNTKVSAVRDYITEITGL